MNSVFVFIALFGTLAQAWRWPWQKPDTPEWNALSVTFKTWSALPMDVKEAKEDGWTLTRSCNASNYFAGNRYVLNGDTAAMLLFDFNGKIAGIQNGIPKSAVGDLKAPGSQKATCTSSPPTSPILKTSALDPGLPRNTLATNCCCRLEPSFPIPYRFLSNKKTWREPNGCVEDAFRAWVAIIGTTSHQI
ncbi:hypothetical protein OS493_020962 [Desmophyllum pertusum]|uniref:Uncharacterized protein n=1 Tax=Desmophyllum pertusum TaxID=174260 RepID=A0A9X0D857_9CNID|nr:hypothetical protein OS493_020962 [Desmophyllum pertusum]